MRSGLATPVSTTTTAAHIGSGYPAKPGNAFGGKSNGTTTVVRPPSSLTAKPVPSRTQSTNTSNGDADADADADFEMLDAVDAAASSASAVPVQEQDSADAALDAILKEVESDVRSTGKGIGGAGKAAGGRGVGDPELDLLEAVDAAEANGNAGSLLG